MPTSKWKEHAQEVEFVSIYNKRLRKSFLISRNVYKQPAQPYNVLHSKLRSGTCSNDSLLPQTPHSKAEQTLPFTFNADGDPECILDSDAQWIPHKKKQGKVRTPSCSPYAGYGMEVDEGGCIYCLGWYFESTTSQILASHIDCGDSSLISTLIPHGSDCSIARGPSLYYDHGLWCWDLQFHSGVMVHCNASSVGCVLSWKGGVDPPLDWKWVSFDTSWQLDP